jgi:hypothetical protein
LKNDLKNQRRQMFNAGASGASNFQAAAVGSGLVSKMGLGALGGGGGFQPKATGGTKFIGGDTASNRTGDVN